MEFIWKCSPNSAHFRPPLSSIHMHPSKWMNWMGIWIFLGMGCDGRATNVQCTSISTFLTMCSGALRSFGRFMFRFYYCLQQQQQQNILMHTIINASTIEIFERKRKEDSTRARSVNNTSWTKNALVQCSHASRLHSRGETFYNFHYLYFICLVQLNNFQMEKKEIFRRIHSSSSFFFSFSFFYYEMHLCTLVSTNWTVNRTWCHVCLCVRSQNGKFINTYLYLRHPVAPIFKKGNDLLTRERECAVLLSISPSYLRFFL